MDSFREIKMQLFIALCINIGNLLIGFSIGWLSPILPKLQDSEETPLSYTLSLTDGSWVGSFYNLGIVIGPNVAGYIANYWGRKRCLLLAALITTIGHVVLMMASSFSMLLTGRLVTGFGGGMYALINVIYLGEISSTNIRGMILSSTGVFHCFGSLTVYCIGPFVSYSTVGCVLLTISVLHLIGCMYIPESPIFHMIQGKEDDTISVLNYLGRSKDTEELKSIIRLTKESEAEGWHWREIFTVKTNRKSFFIVFPLIVLQQSCGLLAALYFTTNIFKAAGSTIEPAHATIITGITQFIGTLIVPSIIDKLGRKTLLLLSTSGCCFSMTALGAYFYLQRTEFPTLSAIGWLPLASLVFAFVSFSVGLNVIPNTLMGELFRSNVRSVGSSLGLTLGCTTGFISLTSFGYIVEGLGSDVLFWMFASVNAIGFIFVLLVVPETKGLSLQEIQIKLGR